MATLTKSIEIKINWRDPEYRKKRQEAIDAVVAKAKAARPGDALAGELLDFQIADGYATYVVESSSPLRVAHLNVDDGYQVLGATIRGLRLSDVRGMVAMKRRFNKLLGTTP